MVYIIGCSGPNEQVDELRKLTRVFYASTCSLSSFFEPSIELGSWLQGKFDMKRHDQVKNDGHFLSGSLPPLSFVCDSCNFFSFWCWVTNVLLDCCCFPTRDFFFPKGTACTVHYTFIILRCTPVKYVVYVMVQITPWWSELPQFVTKHLFLGGKQTE